MALETELLALPFRIVRAKTVALTLLFPLFRLFLFLGDLEQLDLKDER